MERTDLSISVEQNSTEATVAVSGEVDMSSVPKLSRVVTDILNAEPPPRVVIDLGGVTFCDSQGIGTLVVLSRRATMQQSCIVLVNVRPFLRRVLDITGLGGALMIKEPTT